MNSIDIAKIAGVSRSTVSRVINNYSNVPDETREKVLKVIDEYNYVPQASARMLAGAKNRIIGLFIVDMIERSVGTKNRIASSPYYLEFTSSIIEYASEIGYKVLVHIIHNAKGYKEIKESFYDKTISGGIFIGENNDDLVIKEIINSGYKVVLVDQSLELDEGVYNKCKIVNADNFSGAYNATKYLINLKHTKIAHITGGDVKFSSIERVKGYKQALIDANIPIINNFIVKADFIEESGYHATKRLLSKKNKPTAIFLSNDKMAIASLKAIKEAGLRVPEDISIIGFDDIEAAKYLNPPLTTIRMELAEMAEMAIKGLISSIENDLDFSVNHTIPVKLIERRTCMELKNSTE
ncbi:LacI family transcriptional regulator [Clostridium gelidum]|uniref:LacI family transcriptional regulator n=1 Tax=Clostridium gelidum TaxID=704125 RepID=A0ABN6J5Z2_9CLOT|nr:LacI family DNA-binding transcriptional regulator [Clostridium gelidum]BCZ48743.1 LacI family transcriptional regulator [Clostridium gelidum]